MDARAPRAPQPYGADPVVGRVQILAQCMDHLQANIMMFMQKLQEILPFHHRDARLFDDFRSDFVRRTCESRAKAKNFPGTDEAKRKALA